MPKWRQVAARNRSGTLATLSLALVGLLALSAGAGACGNGEQRPPAAQTPPRPSRPAFRLVALTDLDGYLEPCGCQSRPLGGVDKAASELRALGSDGVPALFVAAGSLLFGPGKPGAQQLAGTEQSGARQAQLQAETLADALARLSLAAAAPGKEDLARGAESLRALGARAKLRWLAAGLGNVPPPAAGAPPLIEDGAVFAVGGAKVGVLGVVMAGASAGFTAPADPLAAAQRTADRLRAEGAQVVVALLSGDARGGRRLAGGLRGVDFTLLGGLESADVPAPERVGSTTLLRAARDGHGLLVVDVFRNGAGAFTDVSPWTRKVARDAEQRKADELAARIAAWERDPGADKALVAEQKAHLVQLQERVALLSAAPATSGNAFSARFVELGPEVHDDPEISALLAAHDQQVNDANKLALADVAPLPVPKGMPGYVGSQRCGDCHEEAHAWWRGHAHGRAYATLEKRNKQYSLSCVACHVTGYGQPGGAAVVQNAGLTDVGCESCHGPGSLHAANPDVDEDKNVKLEVAESTCKTCHNSEHSDKFEYATYKAKLMAPGHGEPVAAAGTAVEKHEN